ncbi:hypothetical protein WOLCODRAFT_135327 [Wolfiporia cocos MD-104 SS10]|uniref:Peroxisomal membrane protein PEX14 n=1 Tax=Wolfiporia cocos (strain MD-104) TaxID=742152 RepID=A0A2H3JAV8_WOLCO|nr:hypothetical protein WOLCODRAFT_135327 [Wolfiporia cocos MD-104 SS10]
MATPDRQELIRNAVIFLNDPKAQASPLVQRMQFLEAKGLTSAEIDEAMRQSAMSRVQLAAGPAVPYASAYPPGYGPSPYAAQPPVQPWDWRDYFITAVISGSIAYGAVSLFKKYITPHLQPPSSSAYEADRDAMTAQFDAAEALLKEIQAESAAVRLAVEQQNEKVEAAARDVEEMVKEARESELKTSNEIREIREEVKNVREMLPKMMEKNKETQVQSIAELQQELKSLKALLLSRGPSTPSGFSSPVIPSKPTIPAWQLAGVTPPPPASSASSLVTPNGKGKEVDIQSDASET